MERAEGQQTEMNSKPRHLDSHLQLCAAPEGKGLSPLKQAQKARVSTSVEARTAVERCAPAVCIAVSRMAEEHEHWRQATEATR